MITRSLASLLQDRVTLSVECIDRLYLNGYVARLQTAGGVAHFVRDQLKMPIASTAAVAPMTRAFVKEIEEFAARQGIELVQFKKGERKDDVAKRFIAGFKGNSGVLFIGKAQEKVRVFRTTKSVNPQTGQVGPWITPGSAVVNQYYFYIIDEDFGPMFIKYSSYFPYPMKIYVNGHEWAKRQLTKKGIVYEALDNGFASCQDPDELNRICQNLRTAELEQVFNRWQQKLPQPFTAEQQKAGYKYELSIIQAEFSKTDVFEQPKNGREFFEEVIRENIELGRPESVQVIFGRRVTRRTPGRFMTRVLTQDTIPSLHFYYKHSKIKQYFKEGRALRTETTINDTYDFRIGRRLRNLSQLREIGMQANRRLLEVEQLSHESIRGAEKFAEVNETTTTPTGQRVSGLKFGAPRVMALMSALVMFCMLSAGFRNRDLRAHVAQLLGEDPANYKAGRMTYDIRRLKSHGLIRRKPGTHQYEPTVLGLEVATFYTRLNSRVLRPGLSSGADPQGPPGKRGRSRALHKLYEAMDNFLAEARMAA